MVFLLASTFDNRFLAATKWSPRLQDQPFQMGCRETEPPPLINPMWVLDTMLLDQLPIKSQKSLFICQGSRARGDIFIPSSGKSSRTKHQHTHQHAQQQ